LDVVAQNCYNIAVNKCGCCIIQKCMQHEDVPAFFDLVVNLISNAEALAKDQYGFDLHLFIYTFFINFFF